MKNEYDVIIIGAGPAGLSCAAELKNSGKSVLIVEKNNVIGEKICAGGLTTKIAELKIPISISEILFSSIDISVEAKSKKLRSDKAFIGTIDRVKLGFYLKNKLSKKIDIKTGATVLEIGRDFIKILDKKIQFKYLVGADGGNSLVRRYLKLKNDKFLTAIQYIVEEQFCDLEFHFNPIKFGTGYSWIFPHKGYSSVGCCLDHNLKNIRLKNNLEAWMKSRGIPYKKENFQGWIINYDYKGFEFGNIYLAGDAAGFASGLTGEGIYFALISGRDIAKKIINPNHQCKEIKKILKIKRIHEKTLRMFNIIFRLNPLICLTITKISLTFIKNTTIAKLLIKHYG